MDMDMDMSVGGIPWLDQPVMLHSSRQDKCKLPDAQCAYRNTRWRYWYALQVLPLLYYRGLYHLGMQVPSRPCICPEHGLLLLCGYCDLYYLEYPCQVCPDWLKRTRVWRAMTSVSRYMSYRGYRFPMLKYWSPSLGVTMLGIVGAIFFFGMY
jgi:ferric-chelate reductase